MKDHAIACSNGLSMVVALVVAVGAARSASAAPDRSVYENYCATCHGARGDGRGPSARYLRGPAPADFTRGVYKLRSTSTGNLPTEDDLVRTIRRGVPGTAMPPWEGLLSEQDMRGAAAYLMTFSPRFAQVGETEVAPVPSTAPPASRESIQRGRNVYLLMKCWLCHGLHGRGDGPDAPTLKDDAGARIAVRDLTTGLFKGGGAPQDLYRTLATQMDGTPMVAYFADQDLFARSLVFYRDAFAKEVFALPSLGPDQRAALQQFIAGLPSADSFDDMEDSEQARLILGWQWDLVHYLRSLVQATPWWRSALGIGEIGGLY